MSAGSLGPRCGPLARHAFDAFALAVAREGDEERLALDGEQRRIRGGDRGRSSLDLVNERDLAEPFPPAEGVDALQARLACRRPEPV